jgi:hypothetical protein
MAKPGEKKAAATKKRQRCQICGNYNHDPENCFVLQRWMSIEQVVGASQAAEEMQVDTPGGGEFVEVTETGTKATEDNRKEGSAYFSLRII